MAMRKMMEVIFHNEYDGTKNRYTIVDYRNRFIEWKKDL